MKKLISLLLILVCSVSYSQKTKIKAKNIKEKYANTFYKSPKKYNNQEQVFSISKITYISNYKGSKLKNSYQISIHGKVNSNNERILYNAASIDELNYYKKLFKNNYKKVLFFENDYYVGSKKYYDTSITIEF